MIAANNITFRVGKKALFEDVNIKFTEGNCYGIIGANGAGKSTFLKILSGVLEPTSGEITMTPGQRLSVLEQDQFKYDDYSVIDTVILGNKRLYDIMTEKDAIYAKADFTDEDGLRAADLEAEFAAMDGWNAEADAETMQNGLGIGTARPNKHMHAQQGTEQDTDLRAKTLFRTPPRSPPRVRRRKRTARRSRRSCSGRSSSSVSRPMLPNPSRRPPVSVRSRRSSSTTSSRPLVSIRTSYLSRIVRSVTMSSR